MFDLDVSQNIFENTVIAPDGYAFSLEANAGGYGWTTNFTFSGNHSQDRATVTEASSLEL